MNGKVQNSDRFLPIFDTTATFFLTNNPCIDLHASLTTSFSSNAFISGDYAFCKDNTGIVCVFVLSNSMLKTTYLCNPDEYEVNSYNFSPDNIPFIIILNNNEKSFI